jgi:predicted dehydrogenase
LSVSRVAERPQRKLTVTEPGMVFAADLAAPSLTITSRRNSAAVAEAVFHGPHDNLAAEIAAFLDSVRTGSVPAVDGKTGLLALEVAERIQAAIAEAAVPARRRVEA